MNKFCLNWKDNLERDKTKYLISSVVSRCLKINAKGKKYLLYSDLNWSKAVILFYLISFWLRRCSLNKITNFIKAIYLFFITFIQRLSFWILYLLNSSSLNKYNVTLIKQSQKISSFKPRLFPYIFFEALPSDYNIHNLTMKSRSLTSARAILYLCNIWQIIPACDIFPWKA